MSESPEKEQSSPPPSPLARFFGLLWAATALLTTFTFWQEPLFLNLASSFRVQLVLALLVLSLPPTLLFTGKRRALFYSVSLMFAFTFASFFVSTPQSQGTELKLALANIHSSNQDLSRLSAWQLESAPDVLGVLEIAPHHVPILEQLGYEAILLEPRQGNFGLALLCRSTPLQLGLLDAETAFPSIYAEFEDFRILLTHPMPPLGQEAREMGDSQIERLAGQLKGSDKALVVMGDLNATSWDQRTQPLLELKLKDSRKGFGILPTWPVGRPIMQIPIDHILVPLGWGVAECRVGPDLGSDHYPLEVTVQRP